jgi:DNA-binding NarL/FixJ family response regulator
MAMRQAAILAVDDDSCFRGFLAELLDAANFNVIEAEDARSALALTEKRRPDAAILDVNLPGVSGYSLCRELRTTFGAELPIVFISGSRTDPIDRTAGMLIGGDDYLVKPVNPEELIARVRRLLERSRVWAKTPTHDLTEREIQVLQLIAEGCPPAVVAKQLVISPKTVSSHMERILAKLDVHTRAQAVAVAYEAGLIRVEQQPEIVGHLMAIARAS